MRHLLVDRSLFTEPEGATLVAGQARFLTALAYGFPDVWAELRPLVRRYGQPDLPVVVPQTEMLTIVMFAGQPDLQAESWSSVIDQLSSTTTGFKVAATKALTDYLNGRRKLQPRWITLLCAGLHTTSDQRRVLTQIGTEFRAGMSRHTAVEHIHRILGAVPAPDLAPTPKIVWGPIPTPAPNHVSRIQESDLVAHTRDSSVALVGPAGVGKTQIACAAVRTIAPQILIWIDCAEDTATIDAKFRAAWQAVSHRDIGIQQQLAPTGELTAHDLVRLLEDTRYTWCLVMDGIDAIPPDHMWPVSRHRCGLTIATTRRPAPDLRSHRRSVLTVPGLSTAEGVTYLTKQLQPEPDARRLLRGAAALVRGLDGNPHALAAAATQLQRPDRDTRSCADYLQLLETHQAMPGSGASDTQDVIWQEALSSLHLSADQGGLLRLARLLAAVNPVEIPLRVLETSPVTAYLNNTPSADSKPSPDNPTHETSSPGQDLDVSYSPISNAPTIDERVSTLSDIFLAQPRHESDTSQHRDPILAVRMSGQPGVVIWRHSTEDERRSANTALADALCAAWGPIENNPGRNDDLRACADRLRRRDTGHLTTPSLHPMIFRLGWSLGEAGRARRAARYFDRLVRQKVAIPGSGSDLQLRHSLGVWRGREGRVNEAITILTELQHELPKSGATSTDESSLNWLVIENLHELAVWIGWSGQPSTARHRLLQLINRANQQIGPDDPRMLRVEWSAALWLGRSGDAAGAAEELRNLLPRRAKVLGTHRLGTLRTRLQLAIWTARSGHLADALRDLQQQLPDWTSICGPDHPDTLRVRHQIGLLRAQNGDAQGRRDLTDVYTDRRRVLGGRHPDTIRSRQELAALPIPTNPIRALAELSALLNDQTQIQGDRSVETLRTRRLIAACFTAAGHHRTAAAELGYLLTDLKQVVGVDHPDIRLAEQAMQATGVTAPGNAPKLKGSAG